MIIVCCNIPLSVLVLRRMYDRENFQWIDPSTSEIYRLDHMESFVTPFEVKLSKELPKESVDVRVYFSNHCFSRTKTDEDQNDTILDTVRKRNGVMEHRVFCPQRWEFSKRLPGIIKDLDYKLCLEGGNKEILYRQEDNKPGSHAGWYICMKLDFKKDNPTQLELWIRSAHWRPNRPAGIRRHGGTRFNMLLSNYLKSK